jgi:membrane protease YdiL (CAAX protease family)
MKKYPLLWFFILTFSITWGLAVIYFVANAIFDEPFGKMSVTHPVFIVAAWGPNIAALIMVAVTGGGPAVIELLKRFIPIRTNVLWYILALALFPLAGIMINLLSGDPVRLTEMPPGEIISLSLAIVVSGPLGEELGWRGFALSRMLNKLSALVAAIILGLIWGLWHLPSFFMSGLPQMGAQIPVFILAAVSLSVFVTWIFVNTKQNVFIPFLLHYAVNFTYMLIGSRFLYVAVFQVILALVVILLFGKDLKR